MNGDGVIYAMNGGVGGGGNVNKDQQARPTTVQNQRKPAAEDGGEPKEVHMV
jgi:hypothetical protein